MSSTRSRGRVAAALAAALLAGAGTAWATRPEPATTASLTGKPTSAVQVTAPLTPRADPDGSLLRSGSPGAPSTDGPNPSPGTAARKVVTPEPPSSVVIARIGVRMPVLAVGVAADGQMALPPNPANVGWYSYGPRPGDRAGATVLAAHIDAPGYGIGPLARLGELRPGDVITVVTGDTSRRYVVSSTRHLEKSSLDLTSLFARTGPPRLHLITCGGDFDAQKRHYEQNVVVLAFPAPAT